VELSALILTQVDRDRYFEISYLFINAIGISNPIIQGDERKENSFSFPNRRRIIPRMFDWNRLALLDCKRSKNRVRNGAVFILLKKFDKAGGGNVILVI